ncbi:uncharacterized protein LOC105843703 isoform X4 [Hydra vulgaris]|uniref:uncharacterized protein LOC105843703 isoform X4 n=1 Tax=Hydra vulgaris TaxID=6087 RepID=UPI0032EA8D4E
MTSHIVFLIDEDPLCSSNNIVSQIHLACLRILSYYASRMTKTSIFWGYKFYNSFKSHSNEYKQRMFLEYALEKFNKFEQKLYKKVHKASCIQNVKPGVLLKVALSEILTEFQWDQPQLLSPCKLYSSSSNHSNNLVFLITKYPFDNYFNEEVFDKKSFFNALFPPMLFEKFVQQSKIKLCWIYTDSAEKSCCYKDFVDGGIKMAKGSLIPLHTITMFYNNQQCMDIISRDSILQALLNPTKSRHQILKQQHSCNILLSAESLEESVITLCHFTKRFSEDVYFFNTMYVDKIVPKRRISLKILQNVYMYCCRPNQAISHCLEKALHSKEVLNMDNDRTESRGIMIPYTVCTGAIVLLNPFTIYTGSAVLLNDDELLNGPKFNDAGACDTKKLSSVDKGATRELSPISLHLINTSIVNCVDTWFLSNPFLGLPSKKVLLSKSLSSERIKREENSRVLVTSLKSKLSKTSQPNKFQRMQGISWTRWRLMEFNAKKINPDVTEICNAKTDNKFTPYEKLELSCEEELHKYVEEKYAQLVNEVNLNHFGMNLLIKTVSQFYTQENSPNVPSSLLKLLFCEDVQAIREKWKHSTKESMIHEVLLQLHLLLECVSHGIKHNDSIKMVSAFFRFLTFEESTMYVRDHLNKVIMPKFQSTIPEFLQEIYDDLMIEPPSELGCVDISPLNSVVQSPSSAYSNISSVPSTCCERKSVKRFPSVAGECSKKFIAVQLKTTKEKKNDKKVKRNLFEKNVSTPQKDVGNKSCVPDTPEAKQINNLIWKKQDRDRRHSHIDKNVAPVEESPLKGTSTSLNCIRKLGRSHSFNIRSSPRKFYKLQRHPTMINGRCNEEPKTPTKHFRDLDSVINDKNRFSASRKFKINQTPESAIKRRRKAILFSSFTDVNENPSRSDVSNHEVFFNIDEERTSSVRRSIFSQRVSSDSSEIKKGSESSSRKLFSDTSEPILSLNSLFNYSGSFEKDNGAKSTALKRKQSSSHFARKKLCLSPLNDGFDDFCDDNKMYVSDCKEANKDTFAETTVDWLEKIETKDVGTPRNLTFQETFLKLSPNRSKSSPTLVKAGDDIISVSPCLSATSIKCLEKAPLLSPYRPIKRTKQCPSRVASK